VRIDCNCATSRGGRHIPAYADVAAAAAAFCLHAVEPGAR
jgi:hypothetical protein